MKRILRHIKLSIKVDVHMHKSTSTLASAFQMQIGLSVLMIENPLEALQYCLDLTLCHGVHVNNPQYLDPVQNQNIML